MPIANKPITAATQRAKYRSIPQVTVERRVQPDVLVIRLVLRDFPVEVTLDDEEVFVIRNVDDGEIVGFEVPHYSVYWQARIDDLIKHLEAYVPEINGDLTASLYGETDTSEARILSFAN